MADTGEKQAKAGVNGNVPPVDKQFGKPKGNKPNRNGRPKSFDALRKLAQQVLAEAIDTGDGEAITRIEALLKLMSSSRNPADRKTLLEYAYGKPKEQVEQSGEITQRVIIEYANQDNAAEATPGAVEDKSGTQEA